MRSSKLFLLIAALCTAVPSLMGQVPVNVDPNQSAGLQKFFLVPESVLSQIPHQNKIVPIPQNVVSTPSATGAGQSTFHSVRNSHQNPNIAALTPEQAQQAKAQETFRNQVIESNRKAIAHRQEPIAASNQLTQNPSGQFSQNDQFFNNQQQDFQHHTQQQVHPQTQAPTQQVQTPTPARRVVKPQRQKNVQRPIEGVNQVNQQQFQQPRVHHQQAQQPLVQHQFQQPQVQQVQQPQVQQQQFAPSPQLQQPQQAPVQAQPSPAVQRHQHEQVQQHPTSFLSNQPSAESQRRPFPERHPERSQAIRDEDDIIRQQAENAKYSFSSSVTDGINDQQHIRQETRDGLKLAGLYSYSDGFYKRTIHYEADENGYRVINEESEPIGNGPNSDPSGVAEVASDVGGQSVRYSISGQDFPHSVFTANEQDSSNSF